MSAVFGMQGRNKRFCGGEGLWIKGSNWKKMEAVEKKKAITEFERKWKKIRQNIEKIEIKEESKCFRKNENNRKWIRKERKTNGMKKERGKKKG